MNYFGTFIWDAVSISVEMKISRHQPLEQTRVFRDSIGMYGSVAIYF